MAFTINDLRDLTRLLLERPEWLGEVRRIVLTEELLSLPDIVRGLAEAQRRTEERLDQLAAHVLQLDQRVERVEKHVADMRGILLEMRYRDKAPAFFGSWLRKVRVVDMGFVPDKLADRLTREEIERLLPLDLLVRGQLPPQQGGEEVWLAVEVSNVIDENDVARAVERAGLLRKAGLRAVPVVAGRVVASGDVASLLETQRVASLLNGSRSGWEQALDYARA